MNWEKACEIIENNATIRIAIWKELNNLAANPTFAAEFRNTTNYIQTNSKQLLTKASESECLSFFEGLKTAVGEDIKSDKLSLAELKQKIAEFIANNFGQIANLN